MLPTKFHGNRSTGFEDVRRVLNIYWRNGHQGQVTNIIFIIFHFLVPKTAHTKLVEMAQWFLRKASLNFDFTCK